MSCCIKHAFLTSIKDESGQATVEAAFVLPVVFFLLALLLQPICLFYTRATMSSAAAEAARILATRPHHLGDDAIKSFIMRRLAAIPNISLFRIAGDDNTEIHLSGSEGDTTCEVDLTCRAAPLPLTAVLAQPFLNDSGLIELHVSAREQLRPSNLEGEYDDWISAWKHAA